MQLIFDTVEKKVGPVKTKVIKETPSNRLTLGYIEYCFNVKTHVFKSEFDKKINAEEMAQIGSHMVGLNNILKTTNGLHS